jgi:heterodisulfide reductase subunit A-like polyferredoxin
MDFSNLHPSSRRGVADFVRRALAIGPLLALALLASSSQAVEPTTDHDLVIVGAGTAGLYAAYALGNLGYNVLILEATDRHGGRDRVDVARCR